MNIEQKIHLDGFQPRDYQEAFCHAFENGKYKKYFLCWPRRAGKDVTCFNLVARAALLKVGVYYYVFPTYSQGKKVIYDSITNEGKRFIDYIPKELIAATNSQELKIKLINGSMIQIVGSDNIDSLMGTNPQGIVFSEYALQSPNAYALLRPILAANNGWVVMESTPRGKNHFWELFQIATHSTDWFVSKLTLDDTNHIPLAEIQKDLQEGLISQDLVYQEYYTSFDMGVEGAYYAKYIDRMRLKGQIGIVPHEAGFKVFTFWDLGVRDSTVILFAQVIGQTVRIFDCYENSKVGLEHYVNILQQKGYNYGKHIAPHDIAVKEFGSGMTRLEKAKQLGIDFIVAPNISIYDGIESVRSVLSKVWIDEKECAQLVKALENYRQEYDDKKKVYKPYPLHDWASHWCFTADTLILTRSGIRQIIDVTDKDEVLTLNGWKPCTKAQLTQKNAQLVEVKFTDGMTVKCTPDHLFLTTNGWKSASDLMTNSRIQSGLMNLRSILMENCIVYGQVRRIFLQVERKSIERYGKTLSGQYLQIATFIIKTIIPLTTTYGILNASLQKSILNFLDQITRDLQTLRGIKQPNGIDPTREDYGISGMLKGLKAGRNGNAEQHYAFTVNQALRDLFAEMDINKNFATQTAKHLTIAKVKWLDQREDVYDIGVPEIGHFSLSNGAIVHNCDAMRYMAVSLPKTKDGMSAQELDRRYRETRYGTQQQGFFREDI